MNLYCLIRRGAWTPESIAAGASRSAAEGALRSDQVRHIRSYVLTEPDGSLGSLCIYQATGEQAIRDHCTAADLPEPEIVPISAVDVVRPDPEPASA